MRSAPPRAHRLQSVFIVLLLAGVAAGCRTTRPAEPEIAQVVVPRMSTAAFRELMSYRMHSHGWTLIKEEPALMVFEKPYKNPLAIWADPWDSATAWLRTQVAIAETEQGIRLQATEQRIDASKHPAKLTAVSPREMQQILDELHRIMEDTASSTLRRGTVWLD